MKSKVVLWSVVSVLMSGAAVGAFLWLIRPQSVMLGDGTKLTLLGVEYGKHHKYPVVKTKSGGRRNFGGPSSFDTTNDTLVVWILQETKSNQRYGWQALVSDRAGTGAVMSWARNWRDAGTGRQVAAVQLDAFPRRDGKFLMRFISWGPQGQRVSKEQLLISNPARRGPFPKWTPDPLPDTQSDDDLNVTLTKCIFPVEGFNGRGLSAKDPANKAVAVAFHCEQKGVTVTNWQPLRIETSDAMGNQVQNNSWSNSRDENGDAKMTYQYGLWPREPWKLRVEMSRTSGFHDDELWTVENIQVTSGRQMDFWNYGHNNGHARTNAPFAETTLNGFHLKLYPAVQFTDANWGNGEKPGGFHVEVDPQPPDGYRMTLAKGTDEKGRAIETWGPSWGGGSYGFQFQNLRNAKLLNVTIALHKSRFVEFTVKPAKP